MRVVSVELDSQNHIDCSCPEDLALHEGDRCVVECGSILEYGPVLSIGEGEVKAEGHSPVPVVLRRATLQDQSHARENTLHLKMATDSCTRKMTEHDIVMQIINVRQSFDRKRLEISYTSEEKIQFKDIVRELAEELRTHVEFQQIGVRDAAGIVGGLGPCGRKLCCCSWLEHFEAVSVRMAKNQRLSPNPNTISGVCGRLKCCLRYENSCYTDLARKLPRDRAIVTCPEGEGCVIDKNILKQKVKVRVGDKIHEFDIDEVTVKRNEGKYRK